MLIIYLSCKCMLIKRDLHLQGVYISLGCDLGGANLFINWSFLSCDSQIKNDTSQIFLWKLRNIDTLIPSFRTSLITEEIHDFGLQFHSSNQTIEIHK